MAQQRLKMIRDPSGSYNVSIEPDTNTLTAQPVALDAGEDFRLIVSDSLTDPELNDALTGMITALKDGQLLREAIQL